MAEIPDGDGYDEGLAWAWCPECESHYPAEEVDCPCCGGVDWEPDDVAALGPDPVDDGWYLDMLMRANFGIDPHTGWRD